MASKRPSRHRHSLPVTSTDYSEIAEWKRNSNAELIDFFRKDMSQANIVFDRDFVTHSQSRRAPIHGHFNWDEEVALVRHEEKELSVSQNDETNFNLETVKKRIYIDNFKKKMGPFYQSNKTTQRDQSRLKTNSDSYSPSNGQHKSFPVVTKQRANTFPYNSRSSSVISSEAKTGTFPIKEEEVGSESATNKAKMGMNSRCIKLPSVWKKTSPMRTAALEEDGFDEAGVAAKHDTHGSIWSTTTPSLAHERSDSQPPDHEDRAWPLTEAPSQEEEALTRRKELEMTEDLQLQRNLPDREIAEKSQASNGTVEPKRQSKKTSLVKTHSPKGTKVVRSRPKARWPDLFKVHRNKNPNRKPTNMDESVETDAIQKDLSIKVKQFVTKPLPGGSVRVPKGGRSDKRRRKIKGSQSSKVSESFAHVPVNSDTCPSMEPFTDRKWYYHDKTGKCRYLRVPISPLPPVSSVFAKEEVNKSSSDG